MNRKYLLWGLPLLALVLVAFAVWNRYYTVSGQECVDAHLHNVGIIAGDPDIPDELKEIMVKSVVNREIAPGIVEACLKKKSKADIRCEMAAKSYADLRECARIGQGRGK